jgi:hypothetical protein
MERIANRIVMPTIVACAAPSVAGGRPRRTRRGALAAVLLGVALAQPDALWMGDVKLALLLAVGLDGDARWPLMLGVQRQRPAGPAGTGSRVAERDALRKALGHVLSSR